MVGSVSSSVELSSVSVLSVAALPIALIDRSVVVAWGVFVV